MDLLKGLFDELKAIVAFTRLGSVESETLDSVMVKVDKNFNAPLVVFASHPTPNTLINISSNQVELGNGTKLILPPIDGSLSNYPDTSINMQTGAVIGGVVKNNGAAFSLPSGSTIGRFRRMAKVYKATTNEVDVLFSAESVTIGALPNPASMYALLGGTPFSYSDIEATAAAAYKTAGSDTAIIENKVGAESRIFNIGSSGSGGGSGGGSTVKWNAPSGGSPVAAEENYDLVYLFEQNLITNKLVAYYKVPTSRIQTKQLKLKANVYSPSTTDSFRLELKTYLIRNGIETLASTDNLYTSTNAVVANAAPANVMREIEFDLTGVTGLINSIAVVAGSTLRLELTRTADGVDAADTRFLPAAVEVFE